GLRSKRTTCTGLSGGRRGRTRVRERRRPPADARPRDRSPSRDQRSCAPSAAQTAGGLIEPGKEARRMERDSTTAFRRFDPGKGNRSDGDGGDCQVVTVHGARGAQVRSQGKRSEGTLCASMCASHAAVRKSWTERTVCRRVA